MRSVRLNQLLAISALAVSPSVLPAALLVDRGLPNLTNTNNGSGANRSNIDWANLDGFLNGDNFSVAGTDRKSTRLNSSHRH